MNEVTEMNTKLAKIKKSCHVGAIVSNVFCIICICGCILALVAAVVIFTGKDKFEPTLVQYSEDGRFESKTANLYSIDLGSPENWHSDVPALQELIDEYPMTFSISTYCLIASIATAIAAVLMKLTSSAFKTIETSDSPFNDKVIKKVMIVMIVLSATLLMTSGSAYGILCGLVTWVVYSILDYGKTLQVQSDETF